MSPLQLPAPDPLLALLLAALFLPFYYLSTLFRNSTDWRAIRRDADTRRRCVAEIDVGEAETESGEEE